MKNNKGFTLIELLVVISIIGVISSIVFVSFSGSRDKARLAKAQNFDAQISHALGAYAVGIWRFEEGTGTTANDESGYGNHGTFSGNPTPVFPVGVYSGTTALEFDGVDDRINCGKNPSLNFGTGSFTLEFWINRLGDWSAGHPYNHLFQKKEIHLEWAGNGWGGNKIWWYWVENVSKKS